MESFQQRVSRDPHSWPLLYEQLGIDPVISSISKASHKISDIPVTGQNQIRYQPAKGPFVPYFLCSHYRSKFPAITMRWASEVPS